MGVGVSIKMYYFDISSNIVDINHSTAYSNRMKLDTAALILSKIGNPTRLKIVRLLVKAGDQGMPVGAIQKKLGIPGSTLTHHITHLKNAGLIRQQRAQATLFCIMEYERLNQLINYLTDECCVDNTAIENKVA
jgi:DNA-binding transcriptional ArsR family regulator